MDIGTPLELDGHVDDEACGQRDVRYPGTQADALELDIEVVLAGRER